MSTTKELKVIKGLPYQVRVRADGYFDEVVDQTFTTDGQSVSLTSDVYNGLSMNYIEGVNSASVLDFSNTVLPFKYEYGSTLEVSRFVLMPFGMEYENVDTGASEPSNFNVAGSLSINSSKVASDFTSSNYIKLQDVFAPGSPRTSFWEMVFKVKTGSNITTLQCILGSGVLSGADYQGISIALENSKLSFYASTNGTSWNLPGYQGTTTLQANTWYWVKAANIRRGSSYLLQFSLSTDGITYNEEYYWTYPDSYASQPFYISSQPFVIGGSFYSSANASPWGGEIDLSETYIKINGSDWWVPSFVGQKETLAGCTYNFTDDGSATTLNCFAVNGDESVVLTPDNSYTNGWLLGTVSIPSHTVYSYNNGVWTEANNE